MPLLSAEDFRLSSERKLAVHNCPLLRSVLITTLLSNLESDTRPFTAILAASCSPAATSCGPLRSPDRENMSICDAFATSYPSCSSHAPFESTTESEETARLLEATFPTSTPSSDDATLAIGDSDDAARSAVITEAELDFASGEEDALLLGDDGVLDSTSSCSSESDSDDAMSVFMGNSQTCDAPGDPESLPVDIISLNAPSALTRADPLLFVHPLADRDSASTAAAPHSFSAATPGASSPSPSPSPSPSLSPNSDMPGLPAFDSCVTDFTSGLLLHAHITTTANTTTLTTSTTVATTDECGDDRKSAHSRKRTPSDDASLSLSKRLKKTFSCTQPLSERLLV